ncbi:DUF4251 domain-containing protein [Flavobacterium sp. 5]|uniref:DUF4251 domain-containing protein n=1 Tax=Flavobacterium sp. 5 TaxID=2035199 RepID=UPI000C2B7C3D|nr:DUF4251 domain-containing protein [Flavobacterium sp. 5]PKB15370.1 uncharacterized protein DUF4251 [Flavobacterium sp. 5]
MKTIITTLFLSFSVLIGFAQEKTKQQIKEEQKAVKQKEIDALVQSKEYEFEAIMAYPQGTRSIDLTTNSNYLRFQKDTIHSEMPFFGRAYSGVGYGGDAGLSFKGAIKDYSLKKEKKSYTIKATVKGDNDSYDIFLTVYFDGGANLLINSTNRSAISYRGNIGKLKVVK